MDEERKDTIKQEAEIKEEQGVTQEPYIKQERGLLVALELMREREIKQEAAQTRELLRRLPDLNEGCSFPALALAGEDDGHAALERVAAGMEENPVAEGGSAAGGVAEEPGQVIASAVDEKKAEAADPVCEQGMGSLGVPASEQTPGGTRGRKEENLATTRITRSVARKRSHSDMRQSA